MLELTRSIRRCVPQWPVYKIFSRRSSALAPPVQCGDWCVAGMMDQWREPWPAKIGIISRREEKKIVTATFGKAREKKF